MSSSYHASSSIFQSTLPARGATFCADHYQFVRAISIHAPRSGSDPCARADLEALRQFQSTLPARGATILHEPEEPQDAFQSTLPARGATPVGVRWLRALRDFNPRSPHGERRQTVRFGCPLRIAFQSTLPARGATVFIFTPGNSFKYFNPRSPHGERRGFINI